MKSSARLLTFSVSAATLLLSACGGGSTDVTPPANDGLPTQVQSVALQTIATSASYSTPGIGDALDYLNRERLRCGLGALKQNATLDQAAQSHVEYKTANFIGDPHFETLGLAGFTGITPMDRALAKGYSTVSNEVFEVGVLPWIYNNLRLGGSLTNMDAYPQHAMRADLAAPYHGMGLLSSGIDIGIAFGGRNEVVDNEQHIQMSYFAEIGRGQAVDGQQPVVPSVRTFPCEGTVDVAPALFGEYLSTGPFFPVRHLNTQPIGHPIYVIGENGAQLTIGAVSITRVSTGQSVAIAEIRTKATDPVHGVLFRESWVGFILPDAPLVPLQPYRVRIEGASDAKLFVKEFTFTPGLYSVYDMDLVRSLGLPTR